MVKGRTGQRVRLYGRGTIVGYKRGARSESSCTRAASKAYVWSSLFTDVAEARGRMDFRLPLSCQELDGEMKAKVVVKSCPSPAHLRHLGSDDL
ncbi:hypothetical protein GUJ93_ZPchr0006g41179 [Zizania palustris]|uniref:Uncharacterized protein n=1 Tax=Zizania palustris TaxID=103762 RepID=A0A8J5T1Q4_ZIZPA|nr:hypothetical protein GUJ93_ZPchr0006g41179 [Zizania palustris]